MVVGHGQSVAEQDGEGHLYRTEVDESSGGEFLEYLHDRQRSGYDLERTPISCTETIGISMIIIIPLVFLSRTAYDY